MKPWSWLIPLLLIAASHPAFAAPAAETRLLALKARFPQGLVQVRREIIDVAADYSAVAAGNIPRRLSEKFPQLRNRTRLSNVEKFRYLQTYLNSANAWIYTHEKTLLGWPLKFISAELEQQRATVEKYGAVLRQPVTSATVNERLALSRKIIENAQSIEMLTARYL